MAEQRSYLTEFVQRLFGYRIDRTPQPRDMLPSFTTKEVDDGALVTSPGGTYGTLLDIDNSAKTEAEIITKYREMALQPECEMAIEDILSEFIVKEDNEAIVKINLDDVALEDPIKKVIEARFEEILDMLDFNNIGYEIARRFYIDGRINYHAIIDNQRPREGIKEFRYIDPRKLRKVRSVKRVKQDDIYVTVTDEEYYIYNEKGFKGGTVSGIDNQGVKIANDTIIRVTSGLTDKDNKLVLGYMHKAIKPLNQLRMLEDATVINRLSRAPDRRVFNVPVGQMPKAKAEQYLNEMAVKHKNRLIYDATTGDIKDDRKFMTLVEDYWFPIRDDGKGTTVSNLQGLQNQGSLEDVRYFQENLYRSLNVPVSHILPETGISLGRSSEITRDELKFQKFILRLRTRFSGIFLQALERHLILTGVLTSEDWDLIKGHIHFDFRRDNFFAELKDEEILRERLATMQGIEPYIGMYFSMEWVMKNVLKMTDEDIEQMQAQIAEEGPIMQEMMMQKDPQLQAGIEQQQAETEQVQNAPPPQQKGPPGGGSKKPAPKKPETKKRQPPTKEGKKTKAKSKNDD